jgi:Amt family ammonium transporter
MNSEEISFSTFFLIEMMHAGIFSVLSILPMVGRVRTVSLLFYTITYQLIVYSPITYWLRNHEGWLYKMGAIDYASGINIHLSAAFSYLGSIYMLGYGK